ncbi:mechanosensitive ion channel family protein [Pseudonocardia spinosispora]|uniref:mechanosensitive ion channel family protein n=1 Tax=Pseudonocardia spinosispora TaxID=103441 RepID=UPI0004246D0C|nr:mechanosensitive ion channel family protein [Pseudonocardia spinosispora]
MQLGTGPTPVLPPTPPLAAPLDGTSTCTVADGAWCQPILQLTDSAWLARSASTIIDGSLKTVLILVLAIAIRTVAHRMIARVAQGVGEGRAPSILRPLRERASQRMGTGGSALIERRRQRAATIGSLLRSIASFVIYGTAFVLILGEFGVNLAPIIASAGVIGVAVGFGAQNLIKDFLSGMFMMLEDQYGVGDVVDVGPATGTVETIGLRVTTIRDIEGTLWYVRNGAISRVGNFSQHFSIALVDVPLGHGADIPLATEIAERAARDAVAKPPLADDLLGEVAVLGVQSVTAEGVTLRVTVTTRPGQQVAVRRAIIAAVTSAFTEASIPPPALNGAVAAGH